MKKTHSGMMGFSSYEEDPIASGDDEFGKAGHESEGGWGSVLLDESAEVDDDDNIPVAVAVDPPALSVPSPLRRSPRRVNQSSSDAGGDVNVQPPPAARSGAPPSSISASTEDRTSPSVNDGVTHSTMAKVSSDDVIQSAMAKASSRLTASKTKNSSNKNKDRTSIAGAIVKLIEQQNRPASLVGESAAMLLMRQMERMNRSMDERDQREKKERRKERKRQKKHSAKKKEKKRAKRAKMAELDDHGGKAGQLSSSSSSSSSSSDDSSTSNSSGDESSHYGQGSWRRGGGGLVTVDNNNN